MKSSYLAVALCALVASSAAFAQSAPPAPAPKQKAAAQEGRAATAATVTILNEGGVRSLKTTKVIPKGEACTIVPGRVIRLKEDHGADKVLSADGLKFDGGTCPRGTLFPDKGGAIWAARLPK